MVDDVNRGYINARDKLYQLKALQESNKQIEVILIKTAWVRIIWDCIRGFATKLEFCHPYPLHRSLKYHYWCQCVSYLLTHKEVLIHFLVSHPAEHLKLKDNNLCYINWPSLKLRKCHFSPLALNWNLVWNESHDICRLPLSTAFFLLEKYK